MDDYYKFIVIAMVGLIFSWWRGKRHRSKDMPIDVLTVHAKYMFMVHSIKYKRRWYVVLTFKGLLEQGEEILVENIYMKLDGNRGKNSKIDIIDVGFAIQYPIKIKGIKKISAQADIKMIKEKIGDSKSFRFIIRDENGKEYKTKSLKIDKSKLLSI